MSRYSDQIRDEYGRLIPGVSIYVYKWDAYTQVAGVLETLTDDLAAPLVNPLISDADGLYYFNSADGQKLLEYHYGGKVQERTLILVGALPVPQATFAGLFVNASALTIPVGMDLITTTGYSSLDKGAAVYTSDATTVNAAYVAANPLTSFIEVGGRGFRLSTEQDLTPEMFGATGLGVADDYPAFQALLNLLPAAGGSVTVLAGTYKLLTTPTWGSKVVRWNISSAATFTGAGANLFLDTSAGSLAYQDTAFSITKAQASSKFKAFQTVANAASFNAFQSITLNGTVVAGTNANFLATAAPDNVTFSGWGLRGGTGSNPLIVSNFGCWMENNLATAWAQEIDVNNEGATQTEGSDTGGVGIAINTGSTYSPDTAVWVRRQTGAGTGPGFLRGVNIEGARIVGVRVMAMDTTTYPSLTPAAPGTVTSFATARSSDAQYRFTINETGLQSWGPGGSTVTDTTLQRTAVNTLTMSGSFVATLFFVGANQVVGARQTGWTADTGTAEKTAHATYTAGATLTFSATYTQSELTALATRLAAVEAALQSATRGQKAVKDLILTHGLGGA